MSGVERKLQNEILGKKRKIHRLGDHLALIAQTNEMIRQIKTLGSKDLDPMHKNPKCAHASGQGA